MELFAIHCTTCNARLKVRDAAAIGKILSCPKCHSMVQVLAPAGWQAPAPGEAVAPTKGQPEPATASDSFASGMTIRIPVPPKGPTAIAKIETPQPAELVAATGPVTPPPVAINPDDIPPMPPAGPREGIFRQFADGFHEHRLPLVAAPAAVLVIAVLAWLVWGPTPTAEPPLPRAPVADQGAAPPPASDRPPQVEAGNDPAKTIDNALEPDTNAAATAPPVEQAGVPPPNAAVIPAAEVAEEAPPAAADDAAEPAMDEGPVAELANKPVVQEDDATDQPPGAMELSTDETEEPLVAKETIPQVDVAARLTDKLPALQMRRVPLADFLEVIARLSTIPITIDVEALAAAGIRVTEPVTVQAADTTIGEALDDVLAKAGLIHLVEDQQLLVTTIDRQAGATKKITYDVQDLAGAGDAAGIASLVTRFVKPASWDEEGGAGHIQANKGELIVIQSPLGQKQVAAFLDRLRSARGLPTKAALKPEEAVQKSRYLRAKGNLDKTVTANFGLETPLVDVLSWLGRATGTRMLVDEASLAAAGLWSRSPAKVVADHQPLYEVLNNLLDPMGMTFRIVDERTIQVLARKTIADHLECEFYPVADLLGGRLKPDDVLARLHERIDPPSWRSAGGLADAAYDEAGKCLLVTQSPAAQIELENLLGRAKGGARTAP